MLLFHPIERRDDCPVPVRQSRQMEPYFNA